MGDLIEIVTVPNGRAAYYKVASGGIKIDIKGDGNALIGLSKKLKADDCKCDFWIVLIENNKSWIRKMDGNAASAITHNILDPTEYRSFWILWDSQSINLGREGECDPFITYRGVIPQLKYITFAVKNGVRPLCWRFELAPEIPRPELKPLSGGEPVWVAVGDQLPHGAVIGGYENGTLYVIRARHRHSLTPGKFVPSEGIGYIPWGSEAHETEEFEVLVGYNCVWVPTTKNQIPVGAIIGGHTENYVSEDLYIGRAKQDNHIIPGKVQPSHGVCYVPFEGRECAHRDYEILVSLEINKRCSNNIFHSLDMSHSDLPTVEFSDEE